MSSWPFGWMRVSRSGRQLDVSCVMKHDRVFETKCTKSL